MHIPSLEGDDFFVFCHVIHYKGAANSKLNSSRADQTHDERCIGRKIKKKQQKDANYVISKDTRTPPE